MLARGPRVPCSTSIARHFRYFSLMSRPIKRTIALLALGGIFAALVVTKMSSTSKADPSAQKKGKSKAVLVTTETVEPGPLVDHLSTVGTLKPDEQMAIKNEVPGKVTRLGFEEGDRVEEGQLLLQMRNASIRARLKVKQQRIALSEKEVERSRKVLEKGGISQQEFDIKKNELEVLKAETDEIRAELDKTTVRAPFDGVVGLRSVSEGSVLTTGTEVATLHKIDPIELEFTVPERYAGRIDEGTEVRFRTHGSDAIQSATVFAIEPSLEADNRVLRLRARTDNSERNLRPGAYAQVRAVLDRKSEVLTVPAAAVVTSNESTDIWVNVDGEAQKRTIETGVRTENRVEVTDGLSAGDTVVVTGRQQLQEGAKLEVDTSDDAMDVNQIEPDPSDDGMRNKWFSEETLEQKRKSNSKGDEQAGSDSSGSTGSDESQGGEEP